MQRYSSRFGAERMKGMIEMMQRVGRALEPPVAFSYGGLVANTIASHVLLEAALVEGGPALQDRVVERFFSFYFEREGNIGDRDALARMAAEAGMEESRARALIAEGSPAAAAARALVLKTEAATKRRFRVSGVPFFVIDNKVGVSGAQDPEAFLEIFGEIADE
jgi:predicted DsbA family dithiol-disulfide isomerase